MLGIVAGIYIFTDTWRGFVSVVLGGSAWIIPSMYFSHKLFNQKTILNLHALLKNFLLGEGVKLLLSAGLIILFIFIFPVQTKSFLVGYIATIAASFFMLFL